MATNDSCCCASNCHAVMSNVQCEDSGVHVNTAHHEMLSRVFCRCLADRSGLRYLKVGLTNNAFALYAEPAVLAEPLKSSTLVICLMFSGGVV